MDRRIVLIVAASLLFGVLGWQRDRVSLAADEAASPEAKQPAQKATRIALIDFGKVFTESQEFNSRREALKEDLGKSENEAKVMAVELQTLEAGLKQLKEGSREHDNATDELALKKQAFEAFRKQAQRHFAKLESKLYVTVYETASGHIKKYAHANGIDMVIRFESGDSDFKDKTPEQALKSMNKMVVYQNALDITGPIIEVMNSRLASAAPISK